MKMENEVGELVRPDLRKDPEDEIIGEKVVIKDCQAREHGDNPGCVCGLRGFEVEIEKRYETPYAGTPSYHIKGSDKRVRRSEVLFQGK